MQTLEQRGVAIWLNTDITSSYSKILVVEELTGLVSLNLNWYMFTQVPIVHKIVVYLGCLNTASFYYNTNT